MAGMWKGIPSQFDILGGHCHGKYHHLLYSIRHWIESYLLCHGARLNRESTKCVLYCDGGLEQEYRPAALTNAFSAVPT
jgi:hypothetical protein